MQRRHPEPYPNIFFEMDGVHIQQVFDELADRFGFPEKLWKAKWRAHLDKQARGEDEVGLFLKFGNEHINPILNQLLLRTYSHATFSNLCEYVIKKSATYIAVSYTH
ncbi:MAG: hypothetical protein ABL895_21835, partial [Cyclobacteriaceae bacterium]